eukprot:jgi/Picre1/28949/NNA_004343.t1
MGNSEEERESEEESEEDVETAEEKRLRLAKQYLSHIEQLNEEHDEGGVAEILVRMRWNHGRASIACDSYCLTRDDAKVFSVSKDGSIMELDVESGKRQVFSHNSPSPGDGMTGGAPWMTPAARQGSRTSLLAAAVSSDGSIWQSVEVIKRFMYGMLGLGS